eukprot:TRINITY_DN8733_c0_g1_i6.p1 TRINITY_DN8733_c0_g1~~TRINITY_DN8733_c0_g1_i6.p1  ORF type:complete len:136 (-),score=27.58 TRINITY_DN8733_c0_g1_i6:23-394(-)
MSKLRGRPVKHPRPPDCPHIKRAEHSRGVCYQCSANIHNKKKKKTENQVFKKSSDSDTEENSFKIDNLPQSPIIIKRKISTKKIEAPEAKTWLLSTSSSDLCDPSVVELNIGGKIFALSLIHI